MKKYKINEICEVVCGGTPSTTIPSYWDGNIVWLTPKDLSINKNKYIDHSEQMITSDGLVHSLAKLFPIGSILLSSRAPIGYIGISKVPMCSNKGFKSLICNPSIVYNEFLYYLLSSKVKELKSISTGSTFTELSTTTLKQCEVELPKLTEQQHMVNTRRIVS